MTKLTKSIIAVLAVALVLAGAFVYGGNAPSVSNSDMTSSDASVPSEQKDIGTDEASDTAPEVNTEHIPQKTEENKPEPADKLYAGQTQPADTVNARDKATDEKAQDNTASAGTVRQPAADAEPVEADNTANSQQLSCTLAVSCGTILNNMSYLDEAKHSLVPADGVIYKRQTVNFTHGENVFDVLNRAMRDAGIHLEFTSTPAYNSVYIEGINNIYEFDCGELSGWMYKVNGIFPGYGCSRYTVADGDNIEFVYTCDLGADVGNKFKKSENN